MKNKREKYGIDGIWFCEWDSHLKKLDQICFLPKRRNST